MYMYMSICITFHDLPIPTGAWNSRSKNALHGETCITHMHANHRSLKMGVRLHGGGCLLRRMPKLKLSCSATCNAHTYTIMHSDNGTLVIEYSQVEDAGTYCCSVRNQFGVDSRKITLSIIGQCLCVVLRCVSSCCCCQWTKAVVTIVTVA